MTTPSGRPSVGASRLGHEYQDVISWQQALHAAHPASTATIFEVESPEGASYDDIVVLSPVGSTYIQAKHVVDAPASLTLEWLLAPQGSGRKRESMAQKALRTYRKLRETGAVELWLYTNRELAAGDAVGRLRDPSSFTLRHAARRVLEGEYEDQSLLDALNEFTTHLGVSRDELLEFLAVWKFQWSYGLPEAERIAKLEMQVYGLRHDEDALRKGRSFVGGLLTLGQRSLSVEELRAELDLLELAADRACRTLSVAAIDVEHNAATAQVAINIQHLFGGRTEDEARGLADWTEFDSAVAAAVGRLGRPADAPVLVHASVRLPAWFRLGTLMRATAGWTVGCQLGEALYFSDEPATASACLTADDLVGAGENLVVTLSVTHDVRDVVTMQMSELLGTAARLDLRVPEPGRWAMNGPPAARRMVEEVKTAIMSALETTRARRTHLVLACPKPIALMLGSQWHRLGAVTIYEDLGPGLGYEPAFSIDR